MNGKRECKVFVGGLSWETTNDKLRAYFENFGVVREAFISVNRTNGRPRGFGFVTFEDAQVAKRIIATKHTIDRREVEAKESFAKEEQSSTSQSGSEGTLSRSKKLFVGGLAPAVDAVVLREHFGQFGDIETAEVMRDHDSKRPRGFGFVTYAAEDSVDKVFERGAIQTILDKQVEIKQAKPRDQMPCRGTSSPGPSDPNPQGRGMGLQNRDGFFTLQPFGAHAGGWGPCVSQPGVPKGSIRNGPPYGPGVQGGKNFGVSYQQLEQGYGDYNEGGGPTTDLGPIEMLAALLKTMQQFDASLGPLNGGSKQDYMQKTRVNASGGPEFNVPSTMGQGWSG